MARKPAPLVAPAPSSVSTSRPNKFAHLANGVVSERTFAEKKFTITEFADMIGFPVSALETIIDKNRRAINRPFYNITQLAERWECSRAQVYNIFRETEFKVFNVASQDSEKHQSWRIPASVVEKIEQSRMARVPEAAA
jgi:hypothetical protein